MINVDYKFLYLYNSHKKFIFLILNKEYTKLNNNYEWHFNEH